MHGRQEESVALSSSYSVVSSVEGRLQLFRNELCEPIVGVSNLRRLCVHGIPEGYDLRSLTWKLVLNLLPPDSSKWRETLEAKRAQYKSFCDELIVVPNDENGKTDKLGGMPVCESVDVTHDDHPLALKSDSKWNAFFRDKDVKDQIERDVMRTHPDMHFFSGDGEEAATHRREMMRALFIYAKLNPGLTYVQGMNEIYAPLYYIFKRDSDAGNSRGAEADAFFCFMDLLEDFRDHFCKQLDNSNAGIRATISRLSNMLRHHDEELWCHLEYTNKVNPQFYAFRWITLLLTQEFEFPDVLRLWDTMLGSPEGRLTWLLKACVSMLTHVRGELLAGDFSQNLKLLQNFPPMDVGEIVLKALEL
ncbi:hypothetical protein BSKO_08188 [Bryopsis sp. KO-2023]|nr:hypothetical protein BSKO_08188 [Bryopsis sp. KO-2023]